MVTHLPNTDFSLLKLNHFFNGQFGMIMQMAVSIGMSSDEHRRRSGKRAAIMKGCFAARARQVPLTQPLGASVVAGETVVTPIVQAVNAYGYSASGISTTSVDVTGRADLRYVNLQILEFSDVHGALENTSTNIGAATLVTAFAGDRAKVARTLTGSAPRRDESGQALPADHQGRDKYRHRRDEHRGDT